jgi:hypothetical protein
MRVTDSRSRWRIAALAILLPAFAPLDTVVAGTPAGPCDSTLTQQIPSRSPAAPSGSELVRQVMGADDDRRESALLEQLLLGNVPAYLRHLAPVTLSGELGDGRRADVTVCVSPDYLAIGSDQDFLLAPLRLRSALIVLARYGFTLPTPRIVDAIYAQARIHLRPRPLPPGSSMRTIGFYWRHSERIREQRLALGVPLGALIAGDKKDLVITNRLWSTPARVAIYGWHRAVNRPIQPLSTVHGARYADYSHGVRLVSAIAYLNGEARPLLQLLQDPRLASLLSDEGVIARAADLGDLQRGAGFLSAVRASCSSETPSDSWRGCLDP